MNVLQNLTALYCQLPLDSTYRTVIQSMMEQLSQMENTTVYEMADLTNSSRTTLSRMVQKMGYKSVSDFQYALNSAIDLYQFYNRILPAEACQSEEQILQKLTSQHIEATEILLNGMTPERLHELTMQIGQASQIQFSLPYRFNSVLSFMQNLSMAGKKANCLYLIPEMLEAAGDLDENSILIIGSIEFAEALSMKEIFRTAKGKGALIWLAGDNESRYSKYADEFLLPRQRSGYSYLYALDSLFLGLSENFREHFLNQEQIPTW